MKTSLKSMGEENQQVAEAKERAVVVPHLLQNPEVPVPVAIRVRLQVRNPVVAIGMKAGE